MKQRLEGLCRRWPWFGRLMRIQNRYSELNGNYLATAVTLAGFLSLFPLLLVGFAALGFIAHGRVDFANDVITRLGLTGEAAKFVSDLIAQTERSRQVTSVIGLLGLLWTGLGLVAAVQYALNTVWQVKGNGWKDKPLGLLWLAGAAALFIVSFAVVGIARHPALAPLGILGGFAIDVGLWLWTMKVLTNRKLPWRAYLPGALAGAAGLAVLKVLGGFWLPRMVESASALYGSLGVVFAILAWLLLFGRLLVYASVVNVVAWEDTHGTVTVDLAVPKVPGDVPVEATRAGDAVKAPA